MLLLKSKFELLFALGIMKRAGRFIGQVLRGHNTKRDEKTEGQWLR